MEIYLVCVSKCGRLEIYLVVVCIDIRLEIYLVCASKCGRLEIYLATM